MLRSTLLPQSWDVDVSELSKTVGKADAIPPLQPCDYRLHVLGCHIDDLVDRVRARSSETVCRGGVTVDRMTM